MNKNAAIYVAGGETLIGAAIIRQLTARGYSNIVNRMVKEPDLTDAAEVDDFFARMAPEYVFVAAGKSGGIAANKRYQADLILDNLLVACHIIDSAHRFRVEKLLYLASSCSYPKHCPQPMRVAYLMAGHLEPTNEAYATAKIAGIQLCRAYRLQHGRNFISAIPANAFGPGDDFSLENSHVIAALIRKIHEAKKRGSKSVVVWGTGTPRREFIFADELARACLFVMDKYDDPEPINLGSGQELSILELARTIQEVVGYTGELEFDSRRPDGMPLKALDSSKLKEMGWRADMSFREALTETYNWFVAMEHSKCLETASELR